MMSGAGGWCNPSWEAVSSCGCTCAAGRQNKDWSSQTGWRARKSILYKEKCNPVNGRKMNNNRKEERRRDGKDDWVGGRARRELLSRAAPHSMGLRPISISSTPSISVAFSVFAVIRCHVQSWIRGWLILPHASNHPFNTWLVATSACLCSVDISFFYLCSFFCFSSLSLGGVSYLRCLLGAGIIFLVEVCSCFTLSVTNLPCKADPLWSYKILTVEVGPKLCEQK